MTETKEPPFLEAFPLKIKVAIATFVIAKVSGIASMMSLFAGLRQVSLIFLVAAGISLALTICFALLRLEPKEMEELSVAEIEAVKSLIKSGKLDTLIKEVRNEQT